MSNEINNYGKPPSMSDKEARENVRANWWSDYGRIPMPENYPTPDDEPLWYTKYIPSNKKFEIVEAVTQQMSKLPPHLVEEWHKPIMVEKRFFQEASEYIDIPHSQYWAE